MRMDPHFFNHSLISWEHTCVSSPLPPPWNTITFSFLNTWHAARSVCLRVAALNLGLHQNCHWYLLIVSNAQFTSPWATLKRAEPGLHISSKAEGGPEQSEWISHLKKEPHPLFGRRSWSSSPWCPGAVAFWPCCLAGPPGPGRPGAPAAEHVDTHMSTLYMHTLSLCPWSLSSAFLSWWPSFLEPPVAGPGEMLLLTSQRWLKEFSAHPGDTDFWEFQQNTLGLPHITLFPVLPLCWAEGQLSDPQAARGLKESLMFQVDPPGERRAKPITSSWHRANVKIKAPWHLVFKCLAGVPLKRWGDDSVLSHVWLFVPPWTVPTRLPCHGILQARILERAAISSSRESSWCRDRTRVSCIAGGFFTI